MPHAHDDPGGEHFVMHTLQLVDMPAIATLTIESICCSNIPNIVVLHLVGSHTLTDMCRCRFACMMLRGCGLTELHRNIHL
mmetsp:Transcript_15350/g.22556  ORF Transcript_15350/g.22556 Transcript_15350/m.22556 type:complete len:81 (+) Transcript_15350:552-794(+)